jgi:hypothetical protein
VDDHRVGRAVVVQEHLPDGAERDLLRAQPDTQQAQQNQDTESGQQAERAARVWRASLESDPSGVCSHRTSDWY